MSSNSAQRGQADIEIDKLASRLNRDVYWIEMGKYQLRKPSKDITFRDAVAASLRESILDGRLAPGLHLVEEDIADQLEVSRIPVREAITLLVQEGLVVKEPYKGAYVHPYTEKNFEEITSVRMVLEQLAVEYTLRHWSNQLETELAHIVGNMETAWQGGDKEAVFSLDAAFHTRLYEAAQHDILLEVLSNLRAKISRFLHESASVMDHAKGDQPARDHLVLLQALSSGNITFAQAEMVRHLLIGRDRVKNHYAALRRASEAMLEPLDISQP